MSYRRLWVLLSRLPPESWTQTALRDVEEHKPLAAPTEERRFGPWAHTDYLLAELYDAIQANTYVTAVTGHIKDPVKPEPRPRPGLERPVAKQSDAAVLYLDKLRARG